MDRTSATSARCGRADLERYLREVAFAGSDDPDMVGVEVELIPVDAETRRVLPIDATRAGGKASGPFLRDVGVRNGWRESVSPAGSPALLLPGGGQLSFEPGGQLEYSSTMHRSVDRLAARVEGVLGRVEEAARSAGIALVDRGFDPEGPLESARLQLGAPRYVRMAGHYGRLGSAGRRMMCQSAAIHVNVDLGDQPLVRWSVVRRAAPWLLAAFANSHRAGGRETGHRSWRAAQWRRLDASRTGLPGRDPDPVADYLGFALGAAAFLLGEGDAPAEPFRRWLGRGVSLDDARLHLTTLFPEVRPRGYLEVRCFDALPLRWCAVPATVCAGLLYDPEALAEADRRLPEPGPAALERAGRLGVKDRDVRTRTLEVLSLALEGARRLPPGMVGTAARERAVEYRERFTARGRDPGDEPGGG